MRAAFQHNKTVFYLAEASPLLPGKVVACFKPGYIHGKSSQSINLLAPPPPSVSCGVCPACPEEPQFMQTAQTFFFKCPSSLKLCARLDNKQYGHLTSDLFGVQPREKGDWNVLRGSSRYDVVLALCRCRVPSADLSCGFLFCFVLSELPHCGP